MKNKFLVILVFMFMFMQSAISAPFSGTAKTKRIPAGTVLSLKMLNSIDTSYNTAGNDFTAMLITDQKADDNDDIILPMGSIVRGSVRAITPAKRMSKGAILYLDFDHVVTPNGRQIPLSLTITGRNDMTFDGGITTTKGYKDAWKKTCSKSADITRDAVEWGTDIDNGFKYVVVPFAAIGGGLGTAGYFMYGSVADAIKKGKNVQIYKNDIMNVILTEPVDVPVI